MALKAVLGKKIGMTRVFTPEGKAVAVSVVEIMPNTISQIKTLEKDGYNAVQIAYGQIKKPTKAIVGHLKKSGLKSSLKIAEFKADETVNLKVGDRNTLDVFQEGDKVKVTAVSKGKGFAGTIKRWGFHRGPKTHGSNNIRQPGSIGSMFPQRVVKGRKMYGHLGAKQASVLNLKIVKVNKENNLLLISGAIPGPAKSIVKIQALNH